MKCLSIKILRVVKFVLIWNRCISSSTDFPTLGSSSTLLLKFSTEPCVYYADTNYFECSALGRYPNLNDATCQTYFLCNLLRNGSYIKTKYSCPETSYFNPPIQICDTSYKCPCSDVICKTSTAAPNIEFSTTTALTESTPSSTTQFLSTSEPDTTQSTTVTSPILGTTTEQCLIENDPNYFECSTTGRFPNLNDITCQTYFLCNLLRNGTYIKTKYSCPETSYFNPPIQVCDTSYTCACSEITLKTTVSTPSTELSTTTESTISTHSSTTQLLTTSEPDTTQPITATTPTSETTTAQCVIENDPDYFECSTTGRFPNLNDVTCQTYFLCNLLRNGTYIKTKYSCPDTSYFNPPIQVCDTSYTCACSEITLKTTVSTPSTELSTTTESTISTHSSTTQLLTTSEPDTTQPITATTPTSETTTAQCVIENDPDYFECSTTGRFPNLNDITCQTYFLCNLLRNGTYIKTKYSCPETSYFNPPIQVCDTSYTCACSEITLKTTASTPSTELSTTSESIVSTHSSTTQLLTTSEPDTTQPITATTPTSETTTAQCVIENDPDYFECSATGRFPNLNDVTCQTYFLCNLLRNGTYIKTKYSCPDTSYFNPPIQVCDTSYTCACSEITLKTTASTPSTELSTTTESTISTHSSTTQLLTTSEPDTTQSITAITPTTKAQCVIENDPDYFECSTTGRFPNLNDVTCQTYFLCNLLRNGTYIKTKYSCPETSYFNPPIQVCDTSYTCACSEITLKTTASTPSTELSTTTTESTISTHSSTTQLLTTSEPDTTQPITATTPTSETATAQCVIENDPDYFECSATGRFPNLNDVTCQTYFLCNLLRNGTYIKTKYSCPETSYFNPPIQVCDTSYTCACSEITLKTTASTPSTELSTTSESIVSTHSSTTQLLTTSEPDTTQPITATTPTSETTTAQCVIENDPDYFECSTTGRFPNLNDITCQTYFLCNLLRNGTYIKTKYSCPETSYFNPPIQVCDTSYTCACSEITLKTTASTPSTELSTTSESIVSTHSSTTQLLTTSEPDTTQPITATTPTSETTTAQCVIENDPDYFECSTTGRFPNLNDITCQTYFLCNLLRNGTYIKTKYSCPETSYFNPPIQVCDTSYTCACSEITLKTTASTPSTELSTTSESIVSTHSSTTQLLTTSEPDTTQPITATTPTSETTTAQCVIENDPDYFACSTTGRFPNLNDVTCQTYFLCNLLRNGTYIKTKYSCPETSYFNPPIQVCDTSYTCACSEITLKTTASTPSTELSTTSESIVSTHSSTTQLLTTSEPDTTQPITATTPTSETTTAQCVIENDPDYFACSTTGRFPNLNDVTCQTYFLCNLLRNGTYIKTKYSCPETSYFNPPIQVCDTSYTCACSEITLKTTASTPSTELSTTSESIVSTHSSTTQLLTTSEPDTTQPITATTPTSETTTAQCVIENDPDYFACSTTGRFPNLNDVTCQTYFLCNLLRNGTYIKTKYSCPETSYFNPPIQVCDTSYTCACSEITLKTTASTPSTELSTTSESIVSTHSSTTQLLTTSEPDTTQLLTVTTPTSETTTVQCVIENDPDYFACSTTGRFPNLNDVTCQTYFLCNLLRNGTYIKTKYNCPETSYFNPPIQVCDTSYTCACSEITLKTTASTPSTELSTTSESIVSTHSSTTQLLTTSEPDTTQPITATTPTSETTTAQCVIENDPDYFECSTTGRFPNLNDVTCQTYFLCNLLRNGTYIKTKYSCPDTSYFNPPIQVCDTSYTCACSEITLKTTVSTPSTELSTTTESTISTHSSTTQLLTTSEPDTTQPITATTPTSETTTAQCVIENDPDYFECSTTGRFPNLNDVTCQTYFLCNLLRNGTYIKTKYSCPDTSYFNPPIQVCDTSYTCACSEITLKTTASTPSTEISTTTESTISTHSSTTQLLTTSESDTAQPITATTPTSETTTAQCVIENDPDYFECSTTGRFPNLNDVTCQTYFLCNLLRNGTYIKTKYSCPDTSYFNPPIQVCDTSYTCACSEITLKTTASTPSTELSTTTESTISTHSSTTQLLTTSEPDTTQSITAITPTTKAQCVIENDPDYFECSTTGRFPNLNDVTCQTYFLCNLLRNGTYIKTKYSCPDTSYFNPPIQVCDTSYTCACSNIIPKTTTTAPSTELSTTSESIISTHSSTTQLLTTSEPDTTQPITAPTPTSETTTTECVIENDPDYFECSTTGRFPNLNDATCQTYFLCNLLRNGTYIKTKYSCPETSYFNPPIQVCDISYECLCAR